MCNKYKIESFIGHINQRPSPWTNKHKIEIADNFEHYIPVPNGLFGPN